MATFSCFIAYPGSLLVHCTSVSLPSKVQIHTCAVYPGKPYLSAVSVQSMRPAAPCLLGHCLYMVVSLEDPGCFAFSNRLVSYCFACPGPTLVAFNCFVVYRFVSSPIPCCLLSISRSTTLKANYIDPDYDTLKVRLANSDLHANCCIMLGTDKRATETTNWSKFRLAKIHEGDICAFRFKFTTKQRLVLIVHCL